MPSLLTLRHAPGGRPWECDAVPHAYEEAGRVQFKAMPGVVWVHDTRSPNGRGFYRGAREAIEIVAHTLESAGVCKVRRAPEPELPSATHYNFIAWPAALRDYQRAGAAWCRGMLLLQGAALLADDMGVGKSATAVAALDAIATEGSSTIVVCPAVVRSHWHKQIAKWSYRPLDPVIGWSVYSYEGLQKALRDGTLPTGLQSMVIDEIHYCSNPRAARTKAVAAVRRAVPLALGLSGTPMTTEPRDLFYVMHILWPGRFGEPSRSAKGGDGYSFAFDKRYCDGQFVEIPGEGGTKRKVWQAKGSSREAELGERLRACMLRRTKAQVATELPPRQRITHDVELPAKARKAFAKAIAASDFKASNVWGSSVSELLSGVEEYKIDAAIDLARDVLAAGGRPLILTTRKATARTIGEELQAPVADGDVTPDQREALLRDGPVGVATIYAVTTGIDLVAYDTIIMVGLDWLPSTLLQAEARIHRLGQEATSVTIRYLIGLGTLDEVVRERVIERLETWDTIAGGGGDEAAMAQELRGGTEDELIAGIVESLRKSA